MNESQVRTPSIYTGENDKDHAYSGALMGEKSDRRCF